MKKITKNVTVQGVNLYYKEQFLFVCLCVRGGLNYRVGGDYNCKGYGAAANGRSKKMLSIHKKNYS